MRDALAADPISSYKQKRGYVHVEADRKLKDEPRSRAQLLRISHLGPAHPSKTISGRAVRVIDDA